MDVGKLRIGENGSEVGREIGLDVSMLLCALPVTVAGGEVIAAEEPVLISVPEGAEVMP